MSWLFYEDILRKRHFKRNRGSQVKNCQRVSLICLGESVRGLIPSGCDIYWGFIRDAHTDADKHKLNRLDRL